MARNDSRPNVPVSDRIVLHLWEQDFQADPYTVTSEVTRSGIAESCAQPAPNVSRGMRKLVCDYIVEEHKFKILPDFAIESVSDAIFDLILSLEYISFCVEYYPIINFCRSFMNPTILIIHPHMESMLESNLESNFERILI